MNEWTHTFKDHLSLPQPPARNLPIIASPELCLSASCFSLSIPQSLDMGTRIGASHVQYHGKTEPRWSFFHIDRIPAADVPETSHAHRFSDDLRACIPMLGKWNSFEGFSIPFRCCGVGLNRYIELPNQRGVGRRENRHSWPPEAHRPSLRSASNACCYLLLCNVIFPATYRSELRSVHMRVITRAGVRTQTSVAFRARIEKRQVKQ